MLAALVRLVLRHCTLETSIARTVSEARQLARDGAPALLLVEVADRRSAKTLLTTAVGPPTLALVELERGASSFAAFAAGADQVVRVPFTPDELAVRAAALLRRLGGPVEFVRDRPFDGLELSLDERIRVGPRSVRLDPMANSALYLLLANLGHRLPRDEIRALVWGIGSDASDAVVDRVMRSVVRRVGSKTLRLTFETSAVTATHLVA